MPAFVPDARRGFASPVRVRVTIDAHAETSETLACHVDNGDRLAVVV